MKSIKVAIVIITVIGILCGFAACAWAEQYPATFVVDYIDYEINVTVFSDFGDNLWLWEGTNEWAVDDVATAIMDDNGTPNTNYDDVIVNLYYQFNMDTCIGNY